MRIMICGIETETNTFAPWPTGAAGFAHQRFDGDASCRSADTSGVLARLWRKLAEEQGHDVIEGLFATAEPSGPTLEHVYTEMRNKILCQITEVGPIDIVLLLLHGAMVSTTCDDCEGDILAHIRAHVGAETVIGAVLDPHAHLSDKMIACADILIFSKNYPHDDYADRGRELFNVAVGSRSGTILPTMAVFDCRMVGFYPTTTQPMADFIHRLHEAEGEPGVLSVSFIHGFPWGDTYDTGSKLLVIADGNATLASDTARRLGHEIYALRSTLLPHMPDIESALRQSDKLKGLVVMADTADNAGGGAPSDNTSVLRALLDNGVTSAALGCIWDPVAAAVCAEAGVGTRLRLRLGGKSGVASNDPIDADVTICAVREEHSQTGLNGAEVPLGLSVWLDIAGIAVVICSVRAQVFHPDTFTGLGIDISVLKLIVVKSSQHFMFGFGSIADHVIALATPGTMQMDFSAIPYVKRRATPYFPHHPDPLSID